MKVLRKCEALLAIEFVLGGYFLSILLLNSPEKWPLIELMLLEN